MSTSVQFKFKNGDTVEDSLSGLKGTVVASTLWLNGCVRYFVQPRVVKDGIPVLASSVDEQQLKLIEAAAAAPAPEAGAEKTGGPYPDPT